MMQKKIAVFDFDADDCAHTVAGVRECCGAQAAVEAYTCMQDFAYAFQAARRSAEPFDMVFIGVDDMMGMETARNIRELDEGCPMFLVSGVSDYGIEGFRLHALDYLTKPVSAERVRRAIQRIERTAAICE